MDNHTFWKDKPVGTGKDNSPISINILAHLKTHNLSKEYTITSIETESDLEEVIILLSNHYISTLNNDINLIYPKKFIKWYIFNQNEGKNDCVVVKFEENVVGFVHGKSLLVRVNGKLVNALGINFLCVHREHRKKNLANVLIDEITKRGLVKGMNVGIFTGSKELPFKFGEARIFHRPINLSKLIDINYLPKRIYFNNPSYFDLRPKKRFGIRRMKKEDLPLIHELIKNIKPISEVFTINQLEDIFFSDNKIQSFVYENRSVTEFFSFYEINTLYKNGTTIKTAFLYYWFSKEAKFMKEDCVLVCKELGYDLLNALSIGDNYLFLSGNGFLPGTGKINYYFYNFKCNYEKSSGINFIMF
ncbi:N-myristoyl transferase [Tubulinosema ratisbonensis]|uniref:Glycylpeptide N-tetradecanoyltransferase n=1 Tax=Tubulinosema ratisbonensis TaxID=291195 RepID=A0A437AM17_9MICR|nr:N-myristoyl transferase [Tubulinosema ratisbonensis]